MKKCHKCGHAWVSEKKMPAVKEYCETCSAYLHCCLNCRFYEPKLHNQCAIPTTDWVGDKAGANFCDEFDFRDDEAVARDSGAAASARDMLDSVFGGAEARSDSDRLDSFKKLLGD